MYTVMNKRELDKEWIKLILKAKNSGLSKKEVRLFLSEIKKCCL